MACREFLDTEEGGGSNPPAPTGILAGQAPVSCDPLPELPGLLAVIWPSGRPVDPLQGLSQVLVTHLEEGAVAHRHGYRRRRRPAYLPPTTRRGGRRLGPRYDPAIRSTRAVPALAEKFGDDWPTIERNPGRPLAS